MSTPPEERAADEPRDQASLRGRLGAEVDPGISLHGEGSRPPSARGFRQRILATASRVRRYLEGEELARGGMGRILRVWDEDLRRNLAMKVLLHRGREDATESRGFDEELLARFLEEAQITGQLDHPGVVPVHDLGIDEQGRVYFTMRLVRGRDLRRVLELVERREEGWTLAKGIGVVLKVCEAMAFAHEKGVVHRDLKPANVMVGRFGETYVMDWGLARVLGRRDSHGGRLRAKDASQVSVVRTSREEERGDDPRSPLATMDGDVIGTPSYMAPEQASGRLEEVGPLADVYSLGAILYHMLTGRAPHVAPGERVAPQVVLARALEGPPEPVLSASPGTPPELAAICEKAMARDPGDRYAGMLEVAADLEAFLEGRVVRAFEAGAAAEFRKWVRRNRGLAASLAAAVLLALGGLGATAAVHARRSAELEASNLRLEEARAEAEANAARALESELAARRNEEEARAAQELAAASEATARRRSYAANLVAAAGSLRLSEIEEARRFLERCEPDLRGFEWHHLRLQLESQLGTVRPRDFVLRLERLADERILAVHRSEVTAWELPPGGTTPVKAWEARMPWGLRLVSAAASPDGRELVFLLRSPAEARVVPIGATAGERETRAIQLAATGTAAAYDPTGRLLAVAVENGAVQLFAAGSLAPAGALDTGGGALEVLAWRPDGGALAAPVGTRLLVFDAAEPGAAPRVLDVRESELGPAAWSADGELLAAGARDGRIRVWDREGELLLAADAHDGPVESLAFHPERPELASGGADGRIRVWDAGARRGAPERALHTFYAHARPRGAPRPAVASLVHARDLLVSAGADRTIRTWDVAVGGGVTELASVRAGPADAVAFSADGVLCATAGRDGVVYVWDAWAGELQSALRGHGARVTSIDWSRDGRWILTGSGDETARLWNARTGATTQVLRGHEKWIRDVALDADGTVAATASGDGTARIWDPATGLATHVLEGHSRWVNGVAVAPSGERVYTGSSDGTVQAWNAATGERIAALHAGEDAVRCLALDAEGARLAVGLDGGRVLVLDARTGAVLAEAGGFGTTPTSVAFHPSGERIAYGGADSVVRVCDAATGDFLLALRGHEAAVQDLRFSPDGSRLLSSGSRSGDEVGARLWETGSLEERRERRREALALRREAEPLVGQLFSRHLLLSAVVERLQSDRSLTEELRRAALSLARVRGNDATKLAEESWRVVAVPPAGREELAAALERAEVASDLEPGNRACAIVLGAAQLRSGAAALARLTLERAAELRGGRPGELRREVDRALPGLLALAHHALGRAADACESAGRFAESLRAEDAATPVLAALAGEIEAALGVDLAALGEGGGSSG